MVARLKDTVVEKKSFTGVKNVVQVILLKILIFNFVMKNKDKTLNLKASQAIASLGIECESEKLWIDNSEELLGIGTKEDYVLLDIKETNFISYSLSYNSYNLQELLALLPTIGEKLGWFKKEEYTVWIKIRRIRHYLLDTYLSHGMEGCSKEIIKIIKE